MHPTGICFTGMLGNYACNKKTVVFLQILKETGMRCGEAWKLNWTDLDFENKNVNIIPEKGSKPRILSISNKCVAMLKNLPMDKSRVFPGSLRYFSRTFRRQRKRVTNKLQNPRIGCIHFHTLRHYFATMDYYHNKDILRTMQKLGHKNIQNTLIYTHLIDFGENEWNAKVADNVNQATELVKTGFEYVTGEYDDGGKIFRKPK
jgi:integrase